MGALPRYISLSPLSLPSDPPVWVKWRNEGSFCIVATRSIKYVEGHHLMEAYPHYNTAIIADKNLRSMMLFILSVWRTSFKTRGGHVAESARIGTFG